MYVAMGTQLLQILLGEGPLMPTTVYVAMGTQLLQMLLGEGPLMSVQVSMPTESHVVAG